jgi:hypothetical protein
MPEAAVWTVFAAQEEAVVRAAVFAFAVDLLAFVSFTAGTGAFAATPPPLTGIRRDRREASIAQRGSSNKSRKEDGRAPRMDGNQLSWRTTASKAPT